MKYKYELNLQMLEGGAMVSAEYIEAYYGLAWPFNGGLKVDFDNWRKGRRAPAENTDDLVSRYEIELFFSSNSLTTTKLMAAQLGMDEASLKRFATKKKLRWINMYRNRYFIYENVVSTDFADDLKSALVNLRHRTFGSFNGFCYRLHQDLKTRLMTQNITKLVCATSQKLGETPLQTANAYDCITLLPLSTKHCEWLDFGKPLRLSPDRVSKLFFAKHFEEVEAHLAGTKPPELEPYQRFLAENQNGED